MTILLKIYFFENKRYLKIIFIGEKIMSTVLFFVVVVDFKKNIRIGHT